jgi:Flp pilus assembly protein TadG
MTRFRDEEGQVLVVFAAGMLVTVLVIAALVIDIGNAKQVKRQLQAAADAGALAAAQNLPGAGAEKYAANFAFDTLDQTRGTTTTCPSDAPVPGTTVCYQAAGSGPMVYVTTPFSGATPADGSTPTAANEINVVVCSTVNTGFARVISVTSFRPCSSATADLVKSPDSLPCGLCVLNGSVNGALQVVGNGSLALSGGYDIHVNSSGTQAIQANGNGVIRNTAGKIDVKGGSSGGGTITPAPTTGVAPLPDPLAGIQTPAELGLSLTAITYTGQASINPGVYTSLAVTSNLTLNPGVYVVEGAFTISGGANVTGNNVTLYFTCSRYPAETNGSSCAGGPGGYFAASGNGNVSLTAPPPTSTTATYPGLLMFYDRSDTGASTAGTCGTNFASGNGVFSATGTIYAKAATVCVAGNGFTLNSLFVVDQMQIPGNGRVTINAVPSQNVNLGTSNEALIT